MPMSSAWFLVGWVVTAAQLEQEWTNFVIFDSHYLPMAKCWFKWFQRNASPNYLKVGQARSTLTSHDLTFAQRPSLKFGGIQCIATSNVTDKSI